MDVRKIIRGTRLHVTKELHTDTTERHKDRPAREGLRQIKVTVSLLSEEKGHR